MSDPVFRMAPKGKPASGEITFGLLNSHCELRAENHRIWTSENPKSLIWDKLRRILENSLGFFANLALDYLGKAPQSIGVPRILHWNRFTGVDPKILQRAPSQGLGGRGSPMVGTWGTNSPKS